MTSQPNDGIHIEGLGGHDYLVSVRRGDAHADFQLHADLRDLGVEPQDADQDRSVREAVAVLAERQPVADLPAVVDLADLAEHIPDFRAALGDRLGRR
ncbi:hypothetical protein [Streptacidiphilus neutrinimicus]|uniref:hypothetical protein n=1 Tax=Streptacidiphilus neutrinimicus TaxID=105420 RepID=UPI0005AB030A|nr:hypothetical protein [Streptacidiphilus neutrinimicus]